MTRQGTPTAVTPVGMSEITTAPAPMTDQSPTFRPWITTEPAPSSTPSPIFAAPEMWHPGLMQQNDPIRASWPTVQLVFNNVCGPTVTCVVRTHPASMIEPDPTLTQRDICTLG